MKIALQLEREHSFQNQIRRNFVLRKGACLTGDLRLFASTWPFGVFHHDVYGRLGVELTFPYENKFWLYRGFIDSRSLWPADGSRVRTATEPDLFPAGPLVGMRDDREDYYYLLPNGSERRFRLKYVGFECWASCQEAVLNMKLKHFLPGNGDVVIYYSLPIEDVLFHKEPKLSYDAEGFLEDIPDSHPFVRVEECAC